MSLVTSRLRLMILRATFWPLTWCVANLTLPNGILSETLVRLGVFALAFLRRCTERSGRRGGMICGLGGARRSRSSPLGRHGNRELLQVFVIDCGRHDVRGINEMGAV
jgi:hypothetical protein